MTRNESSFSVWTIYIMCVSVFTTIYIHKLIKKYLNKKLFYTIYIVCVSVCVTWVFMWTDNIYGKARQCLALPPPLCTASETTNGTDHTGPIHLWPRLLIQVGPLYGRERSVLHHLQLEELPTFFLPFGLLGLSFFFILLCHLFLALFLLFFLLFLLSFLFYQQVEILVTGDDTGWQRNATPHLLLPLKGWTHENISQTLGDNTCCHQVIFGSHSITGGARCLSGGGSG